MLKFFCLEPDRFPVQHRILASESEVWSSEPDRLTFESETPGSELGTSSFLLGTSSSKPETPGSEHETPSSKPGTSSFLLGTLSSEPGIPSSEHETSSSELGTSSFEGEILIFDFFP
jgi:hypothetical protein